MSLTLKQKHYSHASKFYDSIIFYLPMFSSVLNKFPCCHLQWRCVLQRFLRTRKNRYCSPRKLPLRQSCNSFFASNLKPKRRYLVHGIIQWTVLTPLFSRLKINTVRIRTFFALRETFLFFNITNSFFWRRC